MLTIEQEAQAPGSLLLKLRGDADVTGTTQLREALLTGLNEQNELLIDCSQTTSFDFFAIQLLCSAHRSAVVGGKKIRLVAGDLPTLKQAIRATGFARQNGCSLCPDDDDCLWCIN